MIPMSMSSSSKKDEEMIVFLGDYYKDEMNKQKEFYKHTISELNAKVSELNSTINSKNEEISELKRIIEDFKNTKST